ncbi:O-antigen ligase domain-containing protein [Neorhizobium sp. P12A]|uniref:O-antigen ligase family protein n=1 Tax=Neorhizobium sp. P12A TaxID=2268027 RepID=UPI0011EC50FB|nr:O-antigen ligase family protein [Neorhizobium sp. P12A]KAA0700078.1 O-antigen ligase domain-containing protein [Neorhizobium sp. P12A]
MTFEISKTKMPLLLTLFGSLLWILAASALLVETDTYRYVCGILALIGLTYYLRMPNRPRTNRLGWLCMAWGAYVIIRYLIVYFTTSPHEVGASDWLYAFPFFFPILGFAFALYAPYMERIIAAFLGITLVMLAVTVSLHIREIFAGDTIRPLIMNNQIHGAVACGLIIIFTSFWLLHYLTDSRANPLIARFAFVASPLIFALCLIAIYGAKSKGVWLAMGITLPVLAVVMLRYVKLKSGILVIACLAVALVAAIYGVRGNLIQTAGPTVTSAALMIDEITGGHDINGVVNGTIGSTATPVSMDQRLQLWSNGWEVFSSAPIFGWGSRWLERWYHTKYADVPYTLLHNGYLEMLVRYGLFGAVVMSIILGMLVVSVRRAWQVGVIPRAAMHAYMVGLFFFALTLLSNSNNRLAIGESFALVSSAFACWCNMRVHGLAATSRPQTTARAVAVNE